MATAIALAILTYLGIQATIVAVTITTIIVGIGLSVGISLLAQMFFGQSAAGLPPSDRQNIVDAPAQPRLRSYGRVRVAGAQIFLGASGGSLYRVLAHNDGQIDGVEEHVIDETVVTVGGDGWVTAPSQFANRIHIEWREGTTIPAHYSDLATAFPDWESDHVGKGISHSLTRFKQVRQEDFFEVYPNGIRTVYKQTFRGVRVWDPRDGGQDADDPATWTWTDNAALVILDYLRHESGMAMPMTWCRRNPCRKPPKRCKRLAGRTSTPM